MNGGIITIGGFGSSSASSVHGRQDDVLLLKPCQDSLDWECKPLPTTGKGPGRLIENHMLNYINSLGIILCCPLAEFLLCSDYLCWKLYCVYRSIS